MRRNELIAMYNFPHQTTNTLIWLAKQRDCGHAKQQAGNPTVTPNATLLLPAWPKR
jgi:hypothetical protein